LLLLLLLLRTGCNQVLIRWLMVISWCVHAATLLGSCSS
jgi:hypothetical protein